MRIPIHPRLVSLTAATAVRAAATGIVVAITLVTVSASPALALTIEFTGTVTEVLEDPDGTIEFPDVRVGDPISGVFRFEDASDFDFSSDLRSTGVGIGDGNTSDALLELGADLIQGFAGNDGKEFVPSGGPDFLAAFRPESGRRAAPKEFARWRRGQRSRRRTSFSSPDPREGSGRW